jgi:hypothetical protein
LAGWTSPCCNQPAQLALHVGDRFALFSGHAGTPVLSMFGPKFGDEFLSFRLFRYVGVSAKLSKRFPLRIDF